MLVVMAPRAAEEDLRRVEETARGLGLHTRRCGSTGHHAVALSGGLAAPDERLFALLEGVARVDPAEAPLFLATREYQAEDSVVDVAGVLVGGRRLVLMAGPCAVESRDQLMAAAEAVKKAGAQILRGGAWKPRTSPYAFQGLGADGLALLADVRQATGLRIVTEVVDEASLAAAARVADLLQVGARNMKSYAFLARVGGAGRPVLLKRGMDATVEEWLLSAEYLLDAGAPGVILCERGIRTFADHARNTLDLSAVPAVQARSHLPVIVDPSHGTGHAQLVAPMARAAVAVGADGLLIEVHARPEEALSDARQALTPERFESLVADLGPIARAVGREI